VLVAAVSGNIPSLLLADECGQLLVKVALDLSIFLMRVINQSRIHDFWPTPYNRETPAGYA
jgi:hypothetical protein